MIDTRYPKNFRVRDSKEVAQSPKTLWCYCRFKETRLLYKSIPFILKRSIPNPYHQQKVHSVLIKCLFIIILGYRIPKGAVILGNIWHMLHDSEIWKEPNTFKPERFLDEDGKVDRKADVMVPFGIGNYTHQDSYGFLYGLYYNRVPPEWVPNLV